MSGAVQHGSVNQSVTIQICAEDGTPKEDVVYNTTDLALWYRRSGGIKVDIELATLSALTDTHSDGGFLHIDDGAYRLDVQDAAYASGANELLIGGSVPSGVVIPVKIPLVAYDPQTVRVGAAAAGAQMDLVDAPNATAVAAIKSGLSTFDNTTDTVDANVLTIEDTDATDYFTSVIAAIWAYATRTITGLSQSALAQFAADDTGETTAAAGSVAKLSQATATGTGAFEISLTIKDSDEVVIPDCEVWLTPLEAQTPVLVSGTTNGSGIVSFLLDAGSYRVYRQKSGYNFTSYISITIDVEGGITVT